MAAVCFRGNPTYRNEEILVKYVLFGWRPFVAMLESQASQLDNRWPGCLSRLEESPGSAGQGAR